MSQAQAIGMGHRPLPWLAQAPGALAFGLRMWASVCVALFVAFWLQLPEPSWAGTSAAIVCQPVLGASLRKASKRLVGTCVGAAVLVVLIAAFPQSREGFLIALALWCGVCGFGATVLRNFASYGAALAGYTAVIIAADSIADPGNAFLLAIGRASEICLGIVCAGVVLTLTDRGHARRDAAAAMAAIAAETWHGFAATLRRAGEPGEDSTDTRRALVERVSALSVLLDATAGESSDVRTRGGILHSAVEGLFDALSEWRAAANHLEATSPDAAQEDAGPALTVLPPDLDAGDWQREAARRRTLCQHAAVQARDVDATTPASRLVADRTGGVLAGLADAANGVALLADPGHALDRRPARWFLSLLHPPDVFPGLLNGLRCTLTVLAMSALWIWTAWPDGPSAIIFAAVIVLLLPPQGEAAFGGAVGFLIGTTITAGLAGIAEFALVPGHETPLDLCLIIGLFIVPSAALSAGTWQKSTFVAMSANFVPLLAPANLTVFDTGQFYNSAIAIVVGVGGGVLAILLLPPASPAFLTRRLLALTLRDLRRLAASPGRIAAPRWQASMQSRLTAIPPAATPLQRAQLVAALWVGSELLRLRDLAGTQPGLRQAFSQIATGRTNEAVRTLRELASLRELATPRDAGLRERAGLLGLSEALTRHARYFDMAGQERPDAV